MSYSKYYLYKKQYSNDSGVTWYDVTPLEQVPSGSPIATYDTLQECQGQSDLPYLTIIAGSSDSIKRVGNSDSIQYSKNGGVWTTFTSANTVSLSSGDKLRLKGNVAPTQYGVGTFSASTGTFSVSGNAMSLLYGDDFVGKTSLSGKTYAFNLLFYNCTGLTSIEKLVLPATTLEDSCYANMFSGCTSLTTVPSNLLPATTLEDWCYYHMFDGCTSLTAAPTLPATTLAGACYNYMFYGCSGLTTAPTLPATTLKSYCYAGMFRDCTSLRTAPTLSASTLVSGCCAQMFYGCSSLSAITCFTTTNLTQDNLSSWTHGVASAGTFTKVASATWTTGDDGIPTGWSVVNT